MTLMNLKGLAMAAGLTLMGAASPASAACLTLSYVDVGCFSSPAVAITTQPSAQAGFIGVGDAGGAASLTLGASSFVINYITFRAATLSPNNPFSLSIAGFINQATNLSSAFINFADPQEFTFFSATGVTTLNFFLNANGQATPTAGEIGRIVAQAPAPIPGAGFLSFLSVAFAGLWRRGRSVAARVLRRRELATA